MPQYPLTYNRIYGSTLITPLVILGAGPGPMVKSREDRSLEVWKRVATSSDLSGDTYVLDYIVHIQTELAGYTSEQR